MKSPAVWCWKPITWARADHHLYNSANVNRYRGDLLATGVFHGFNSSFNAINMISSTSNSVYHGGTVQARKMFGNSFMLQGAFTYGKVLDDADDLVNTSNYLDIANRRLDRSLAGFDVSRKLAIVSVWEMPFLRGQKNLAAKVLGGLAVVGHGDFPDRHADDGEYQCSVPQRRL